jgi:V8-like Glu-specific endopeptidase
VAAIDLAKQSVVPVVCIVRNADTGEANIRFRILGTAFLIDPTGIFITAFHVIRDMMQDPWKIACTPGITFPSGGWTRQKSDVNWFKFDRDHCQVNEAFDVAVCRTVNDISKMKGLVYQIPTISNIRPPDGTSIFFTGFPLQATDPITASGTIAGFTADSDYNTIMIDKNAWPGASGSPIFLSDGKTVVGIVLQTGTGDAIGLSYGTSGEKIAEVLTNAKKRFTQQDQQKAAPSPR